MLPKDVKKLDSLTKKLSGIHARIHKSILEADEIGVQIANLIAGAPPVPPPNGEAVTSPPKTGKVKKATKEPEQHESPEMAEA